MKGGLGKKLKLLIASTIFVGIVVFLCVVVVISQLPVPEKQRIAIVGGGLAGLSAAITAAMEGDYSTEIHLFEKQDMLGGNSARASSGMNGVDTPAQIRENIDDSVDLFFEDATTSSKDDYDPDLVKILVEHSTSAVSFLSSFGVDLGTLSQCGGHSAKRTHRSDPNRIIFNVGNHIMMILTEKMNEYEQIVVHLNHEVKDIKGIPDSSQRLLIANHHGEDISYVIDQVILTSGGFGFSIDGYLGEIRPDLAQFPTTNGPWCQGDGLTLGTGLGGQLLGMNHVQVHPTGIHAHPDEWKGLLPMIHDFSFERNVFLASEAIRGSGALLLKRPGTRFVNELGQRDEVMEKIMEHGEDLFENGRKVAWMILNEETADMYGRVGFYASMGLVRRFEDFTEFCEVEDFDCLELEKTINEYAKNEEEEEDEFGKKVFPVKYSMEDKPIYRMYVTPVVHYTMGGLKINQHAQVVGENGNAIEGVFAAGEVTGGIHGKNRLAGNSLLECVVFGRIAARRALLKKL